MTVGPWLLFAMLDVDCPAVDVVLAAAALDVLADPEPVAKAPSPVTTPPMAVRIVPSATSLKPDAIRAVPIPAVNGFELIAIPMRMFLRPSATSIVPN